MNNKQTDKQTKIMKNKMKNKNRKQGSIPCTEHIQYSPQQAAGFAQNPNEMLNPETKLYLSHLDKFGNWEVPYNNAVKSVVAMKEVLQGYALNFISTLDQRTLLMVGKNGRPSVIVFLVMNSEGTGELVDIFHSLGTPTQDIRLLTSRNSENWWLLYVRPFPSSSLTPEQFASADKYLMKEVDRITGGNSGKTSN